MNPTAKPGPKHKPVRCGKCDGSGQMRSGKDERGRPRFATCDHCKGKGET